MGENKTMKI